MPSARALPQRMPASSRHPPSTPLPPSPAAAADGSIPQQPLSELVYEDTGRWDVNTFISPALAAALEAAPPLPDDKVDPSLEQLQAALEKLERGQGEEADSCRTCCCTCCCCICVLLLLQL